MKIANEKLNVRWVRQIQTSIDREILDFACLWASLIEKEINLGKSFDDVWMRCRAKAKGHKISAMMAQKAELYLIQVWQYGEQLRKATRHGEQGENRTYYNDRQRTQSKRGNRSTLPARI